MDAIEPRIIKPPMMIWVKMSGFLLQPFWSIVSVLKSQDAMLAAEKTIATVDAINWNIKS